MRNVIALLFLLAPLAVQAQLMKCVGSDGRVEYAAECPPGTKGQQTGIPTTREGPSTSTAPGKQKSLAERDAASKKGAAEREDAQKKDQQKQAEAEQRRRACADARSYLASLEGGARLTRTDPKTGERAFVEDDQRAKEAAYARSMIQENCK